MLDWIDDLFDSPAKIEPLEVSVLPRGFRSTLQQLLIDCRALYRTAAQTIEYGEPQSMRGNSEAFSRLLEDLARGIVVKTLCEVAHCDRNWNQAEREVATLVLMHAWGKELRSDQLTKTLRNMVEESSRLKWSDLVQPFASARILREERSELRSIVLRLANIIAKADGQVSSAEQEQLQRVKHALDAALSGVSATRPQVDSKGRLLQSEPMTAPNNAGDASPRASLSSADREKMFETAKQELEQLIGMEAIKADVGQLIDFLRIQNARKEHGLPTVDISFHAIFEGNPGTGKTTVARILSRLLCGLGILEFGQTVEVDRSGLVAQFAGQTGPLTNQRIDEALGGVFFVDEAYSLVSQNAEDAYGAEAVQTMLKRMEDDRDRFVVVLAGYPKPMERMLKSNPGLSSRFQRTYSFPDYNAKELLRIYFNSCKKYHYELPKPTRRKLLEGFQNSIDCKDEHFGNGRLARNLFERSVRNMASRIVSTAPLTREILTSIMPEDVVF